MTTNNPAKLSFAPKARILIAEVTAAASKLPTNYDTPLDAVFTELGYTNDDGIELTPKIETNPIAAHQSAVPIKYVVKSASFQLKFMCLQFDKDVVELYFGKKWTTTANVSTLVLDSTPALLEKSMVIEWGDWTEDGTGKVNGGIKNRLVIPRGMVSDRDGIKLTRAEVSTLGVTFDALDSGGSLGSLITNAA